MPRKLISKDELEMMILEELRADPFCRNIDSVAITAIPQRGKHHPNWAYALMRQEGISNRLRATEIVTSFQRRFDVEFRQTRH